MAHTRVAEIEELRAGDDGRYHHRSVVFGTLRGVETAIDVCGLTPAQADERLAEALVYHSSGATVGLCARHREAISVLLRNGHGLSDALRLTPI
jgi:hypothetical protein